MILRRPLPPLGIINFGVVKAAGSNISATAGLLPKSCLDCFVGRDATGAVEFAFKGGHPTACETAAYACLGGDELGSEMAAVREEGSDGGLGIAVMPRKSGLNLVEHVIRLLYC